MTKALDALARFIVLLFLVLLASAAVGAIIGLVVSEPLGGVALAVAILVIWAALRVDKRGL